MPIAKVGFSPLSAQLQVIDERFSPGVVRHALRLAGSVPYEEAAEILAQIGMIEISASSIWRRLQAWGEQFAALEEQERVRANALPERWQPPSRAEKADQRMGVAMDGFMVPILAEGWKEMKLAAVFDVELRPGCDERTGERGLIPHAVGSSYVAHLGGPELFGELAYAEARRRGWEHAQDTQAVADGAPWIWNQVDLHFGESQQLVDWYHAKQHLADAARLLKGESTPAYTRWLNSRETALYQGHADRIARELERAAPSKPAASEALRREAGYLRQHHHRMNYLEMREDNWVIGSGMVEGGAKRHQDRYCGTGMLWSRQGA